MSFYQVIPEEEVIFAYFRSPEADEQYMELTCSEMLKHIRQHRPDFDCSRSVTIRLGKVSSRHFMNRTDGKGKYYRVVEV